MFKQETLGGGGGEDTKLKLGSGVPERVPETGFEPWLLCNPGSQGCCEGGGRGWASDGCAARQAGPRAARGARLLRRGFNSSLLYSFQITGPGVVTPGFFFPVGSI